MILEILLGVILLIILVNINIILRHVHVWYIYYKLPGPGYFPIFGLPLKLATIKFEDLLDYHLEMSRKVRSSSSVLFGYPNTLIFHPSDLERALGNTVHIKKGNEYSTIMFWLKEGLLTSEGNKWHQRRKILTPTFHFKILEDCLPVMNEHAVKLSNKFLTFNNEAVDVVKLITLCTLDIVCETAMGIKLNIQDNQAVGYVKDIKSATELISIRLTSFWLWNDFIFKLSPTGRELFQVITRLHKFTKKVIAERKQTIKDGVHSSEGKTRMAFLDCLLDTETKNPGTFSDDDIREEVDTFMFEGHDTTSAALVFCLMILGQLQDVQEKVVEELIDIFGDSDRPVTSADLHKMRYLEMVIKETLRLYPSVPIISRKLTSDFQLEDGNIIPATSNLTIFPYILHRDSRIYEDPERFTPERFSEENSKRRHPFAYIPFSAGPRNCIGQKFAMMEMKVVLSTVLRRCRLESITTMEKLKLNPFLVLRPVGPIHIKFASRIQAR